MDHNPATLSEAIAGGVGDATALRHGDRVVTWAEVDDRAARLAAAFQAAGLGPGSKVACYMYNGTEYMETCYAALKIRGVPVNVNYRYLADELAYLLDNSDSEAVVFHRSLGDRVHDLVGRIPKVRLLVEVDDVGSSGAGEAAGYEDVIGAHDPAPRIERSDDDIVMLYTGGTTGMPKGVMYRCGDVYSLTMAGIAALAGQAPPTTADAVTALARTMHEKELAPVLLAACPLMHGTGLASAISAMLAAGTIVTMPSRSLDAHELWRAVEDAGVTRIALVGDAFARPMADALEAAAGKGESYDVSSLREIHSAGTMFSQPVKDRLLAFADITIVDNLASSEAPGMASASTRRGDAAATGTFKIGPATIVVSDDGRVLEPGSDETGMLAVGGLVPLGYYKDAEKSARTFREIDGRRYAIPGDYAKVEADGTVLLLGRGSVCINTAGEKVFPEEVEEAVKEAPGVVDCLVVGVPDERFGEAVVAVASLRPDAASSEAAVRDAVRRRLAGYKVPKRVLFVDEVRRAPNGKADYPWAKETAERLLEGRQPVVTQ